ncbi:hypothetical protein DS6A_37 [Mycobacterium phage DS6A]|uniref:Uncharacterized protein n=1 Tax=Mycobacterium phage DS6A TaxID=45764 RepID=G8I4E7_9CAUD|nr:hypothetical protein DS6A_37 [Mycobacterium phage DS6A]AER47591.1 hypothetical protein DS6A_37 [Mycobacterium phage DS6A]
MRYEDWGWLAVLGVVVAVEAKAPPGQMLSHGAARYKAAQPVLTYAVVLYLAGHLLGRWPARLDPLSAVDRWRRR